MARLMDIWAMPLRRPARGDLPRIAAAAIVVTGAAASLWLNWPGHFSYDSVVQLAEGRTGIYSGGHPLVIEGSGGLLVPLDDTTLYIDVFARWRLPVVLCARTALGTINHSLLSIEALRHRKLDILGIAFIGEDNAESERVICEIGRVKRLGRLPRLSPLTANTLHGAFGASFNPDDFKS